MNTKKSQRFSIDRLASIGLLLVSTYATPSAAEQAGRVQAGQGGPAYFQAVTLADGATFVLRLEDRKLIQQARDIISGKERENIHVSGTIVKATASYSPDWSFHLDPISISFFGVAAEACDASTVLVERNLDEVGDDFLPGARWCPWSSRLVAELGTIDADVISVVSSASLSEVALSPASLGSILGQDLTNATEAAQGSELPTKLAGLEVEFRRSGSSQRRKATLSLASPQRVNFTVPEDVTPGLYTVRLIRENKRDLEAETRVERVAPGLFFGETADGRYAAATLLRVHGDGSRSDESLLTLDGQENFVPVAIDFGPPDDRLYLSLYGSGIGNNISVRIRNNIVDLLYAGPQGSMEGLDQINVELPRSLASRSEVDVTASAVTGDGQTITTLPIKLMIKPSK